MTPGRVSGRLSIGFAAALEAALPQATATSPPYELNRPREEVARVRSEPHRHGSAYFILAKEAKA